MHIAIHNRHMLRNIYNLFFSFVAIVGLPYCKGFSLAMASGDTLVVVHGFLIVVASLVSENRF